MQMVYVSTTHMRMTKEGRKMAYHRGVRLIDILLFDPEVDEILLNVALRASNSLQYYDTS